MEGGVGMTSVYTFDLLQGSSRVGCTKTLLRLSRRGNFERELRWRGEGSNLEEEEKTKLEKKEMKRL
jgi:hypothetical protein